MNGKRLILLSAALVLLFTVSSVMIGFLPLAREGIRISARTASSEELLTGNDEPEAVRSYLLPGERLNINTATVEELDRLSGIGPGLASAIVTYRDANGPFGSAEDIMKVPGIGEKRYDAIKEDITTD